jgi:hypothetical protein
MAALPTLGMEGLIKQDQDSYVLAGTRQIVANQNAKGARMLSHQLPYSANL